MQVREGCSFGQRRRHRRNQQLRRPQGQRQSQLPKGHRRSKGLFVVRIDSS